MKFFTINKNKIFSTLLVIVLIFSSLHADSVGEISDTANDALNNLKGIWDGASKFVSGMAQSFGYVPSDYVYSLRAWNDSPGDIEVVKQEVTKVLGAGFSGKVVRRATLSPYTNTGDWIGENLYFILWLLIDKGNVNYNQYKTNIADYAYEGSIVFPGFGSAIGALIGSIQTTLFLEKWELYSKAISQKDKPENVYYYRAYTNKGSIHGEYLGVKTTTSAFSGVFFNSSKSDISLKFMKDSIPYQVMLEAGTFSLLNSTTSNPTSIRPGPNQERSFIFNNGPTIIAALPISAQGICNMQLDEATQKLVPGAPMVYTYEIFDGNNGPGVGMQGLAVGHYDQPLDTKDTTKSVVRDINPMECHFWYQSAEQAKKTEKEFADGSQIPFDWKQQVWIFYKTKDYTFQKKVTAGSVIDFYLVRPRVSEKNAWFYAAALETNDDTKALAFLNRLADGAIGENLKEPVTAITQFNENMVLDTIQSNTHGLIDDTKGSGIKGYVLIADKILPRGVGVGPFYYQMKPSILYLDQVADIVSSYLNVKLFAKVSDMNQDVTQKVAQWINLYPQDNQSITSQVTQYLQQKGIDQIITNTASSPRTLNDQGKKAVAALVSGPMSIANYPYQQQAGMNGYVFYMGNTPTGWPAK